MKKRLKRLFRRHPESDLTLDPALIMAGFDAGRRAALAEEMRRKAKTPGPCGVCDVPTANLRPILVMPPDSRLLGSPPGRSNVLVAYFCPEHDTPADAARFRAALVAHARRSGGLNP